MADFGRVNIVLATTQSFDIFSANVGHLGLRGSNTHKSELYRSTKWSTIADIKFSSVEDKIENVS